MQENGIVSKVSKNGHVTVRLSRKTACENCRMCLLPKNEMYVELKFRNSKGLNEGDYVKISMSDRAIISSSIIVYVFPIIVLTLVLLLTYKLDLWVCLISSFSSLIISFTIIALIDKYVLKKKTSFYPTIKLLEEISDEEKNCLLKILNNLGNQYEIKDELGTYKLGDTQNNQDISKKEIQDEDNEVK